MSQKFTALMAMLERADADALRPENLADLVRGLTPDEVVQFMVAKNVKLYGGINQYVSSYLKQLVPYMARMPDGPHKDTLRMGQSRTIDVMLTYEDLTEENKTALTLFLAGQTATPAAAGGKRKRKMTRRYCKKTSCRKMGFTQKASCRPYKNCY